MARRSAQRIERAARYRSVEPGQIRRKRKNERMREALQTNRAQPVVRETTARPWAPHDDERSGLVRGSQRMPEIDRMVRAETWPQARVLG